MDTSKAKKFGQRQPEGTSSVRPNGNSCDVCRYNGLKPAKFHCAKCSVYYCGHCIAKHRNMFLDHHVTNLVTDKNKSNPCRVHPGHNVAYQCQTCHPKSILCAICILDHADAHTIESLEEKGKEVRKKLKEGLGKVMAKSDQLKQHIQMIKRKADHQDSVLKTVHEDIKRHTQLLVEGIHKKEREMLQAVKEVVNTRKARDKQGAVDLELSNMEQVSNELEMAIKSSDENCIASHERLEEKIAYLINYQIPDEQTPEREADIKFIPEDMDTDLRFGTFTVKNNAASKNNNTLKRQHDSDHESALDSGLTGVKTEPGSPSTSSAVHTVEKKKKKVSGNATGKPGKPTPQKIMIGDLEIPPPYQEPKCEPVFNNSAPHIFWDIRLSEKKQDDLCNITQLCAASTTGGWTSTISKEVPIEKALQEFITFIGKNRGILCGHNIKENKCQTLLQAIRSCNLEFPFDKAVAGFIDTLPLLKSKFSDFEPLTVEALYQHCVKKPYREDTILSSVQDLQTLVHTAYPDRLQRLSYSFQTSFIPNLSEYHAYRKRNFVSWKPLVDSKVFSRHIGDKAAASGLELKHAQSIYTKQGLEGLTSLLSKPGPEGKPRVTSSQKIIKELAEYLEGQM